MVLLGWCCLVVVCGLGPGGRRVAALCAVCGGGGPVPRLRLLPHGGGGDVWLMLVACRGGAWALGVVSCRRGVPVGVWAVPGFATGVCDLRDAVWSAGSAGSG